MSDVDKQLEKDNEWIQKTWRPAVGVTYIVINIFDFIIFPILWTLYGMITKNAVTQWHPLTLDSTGLFHLSFGAILGVSAWSRGKEKVFDEIERYRERDRYQDRYRSSPQNREQSNKYNEPEPSSGTFRGEMNE